MEKGGWGKKGGYGKGWGKERKPPPGLPEDFVVDETARITGIVETYYKWHGYGFIKPETPGAVPNDKIFVHWSSIQTNDRFPFLMKDQAVEFNMVKWTEGMGETKIQTLRAKQVTMPGGAPIAVQDDLDSEKKTFVGGQILRYTGHLKFYNPSKGFGYVTLDAGFKLDEPVPTELKVEDSEVNAGGQRPKTKLENIKVEFGIVKNRRGQFLAYNMTLPGGHPLTKENVEHKQVLGDQTYQGVISFYNWQQGWGFVVPSDPTALPDAVTEKLAQMAADTKAKGKTVQHEHGLYFSRADVQPTCKAAKDLAVTFTLYTDDKGAGACEIKSVAPE